MKKFFALTIFLFILILNLYGNTSPSTEEQVGVAITNTGISTAMDLAENITSEEFFKSISTLKNTVGNTMSAIDIATKLGAGDTNDAAIFAGITTPTNFAETNSGKAVLSYFGLTTTGLGIIFAAYQIEQMSSRELTNDTNARLLESLYGSIESDPFLHKRNRKFGDKSDPYL